MNTHSVELDGYYARSRGSSTIYLGTAGSHDNEQLQVTQGKGWEGLTVQVVFHPSKVAVQLPTNGLLDVPWEATAQPLTAMQGRIVFQGFDQDRLVNSTDLAYTVASHSPALGRDEEPYTPGIVEGVLNQMAADKDAILQAAQQTGQAKDAAAASAAEAAGSAANAQQSAGAANTSAGQAADSASQAAGSAAAAGETLTQVQTAGQEAQQKVKDAETEALDKIAAAAPALPAVSTDAAWQSVTVKPDGTGYNLAALAPIEATIRPTVTGNPAVCENSVAWGLQGLKIYGKSVQNGTPSPENPVPMINTGDHGYVELSVDGSNLINYFHAVPNITGSVRYQGNTLYFSRVLSGLGGVAIQGGATWVVPLHKGRIFISLSNPNYLRIYKGNVFSAGYASENRIFDASISTTTFDIPEDGEYTFGLWVDTLDDEKSVTYFNVSYIDGQTDIGNYAARQTITFSTPNGLPGISLERNGNYVDSLGHQLKCDVLDIDQGFIVQNIYKFMLSDAPQNSNIQDLGSVIRYFFPCPKKGYIDGVNKTGLCNIFEWDRNFNSDNEGWYYDKNIVIKVAKTRLKSYDYNGLIKFFNDTGAYVLYCLATPITTLLSAEELAAYRALQTYAGTTVVSTAEPVAGLEVQYLADGTKKVQSIESRLAALEAAQTGI